MKKTVVLLVLLLVLSALLTVGASAFSLSEIKWDEIDWKDLFENKVVPAAVTGFTLVSSVYVAFLTAKNKVLAASAKFEEATKGVNKASEDSAASRETSAKAQQETLRVQSEQNERIKQLEKQQVEELALVREQMKGLAGDMSAIKEAVCLGFANMESMVEKGTSHNILKLLEDDDGEKNA